MQTFLFYMASQDLEKSFLIRLKECFTQTAKSLDSKRLGKQRVEAMQILNVILKRVRVDGKHLTHEETKSLLKKNSAKNWPFEVPREKVEKQIVKPGWKNHPCISLWKDYPDVLKLYFNCIVEEWIERKYQNNLELEFVDETCLQIPPFLENEEFINSHRRNMMRKNKEFYAKIFGEMEEKDGYMWWENGKFRDQNNKKKE
jgi:hypothetical protein